MADVSHELGALRFVVDSPLSSKVSMFNQAANKHMESQLLNPFSETGGRRSPKFNKDEYGKPLAGSLTEMRGQKANIHVLKEMTELCQIIDSEGYPVQDEPEMRVILFGDLFNIYTHISDKVVGILLRARKHKLIDFEGEILFQHRDEDVPIVLLKPIKEIRKILDGKQDDIKRSASPAPQATNVLLNARHRSVSPAPTYNSKLSKKSTKSASRSPSAEKRDVSPVPVALTNKPPSESILVLPQPTVLVTRESTAEIPIPVNTEDASVILTSNNDNATPATDDLIKSNENLSENINIAEAPSSNDNVPKEFEEMTTVITEPEISKLDQNNNNEINSSKTPEVIVTVPSEETATTTVSE